MPGFADQPIAAVLAAIGARGEAPAAGVACALSCAAAAALLELTAALAADGVEAEGPGAAAAARLRALGSRAAELRVVALAAADDDAQAYARVTRAADDAERASALEQASEPPLLIAECAVEVAEGAAEVAAAGSWRFTPDAVVAVELAATAAAGAAELVAANLGGRTGDPRGGRARVAAERARRAAH